MCVIYIAALLTNNYWYITTYYIIKNKLLFINIIIITKSADAKPNSCHFIIIIIIIIRFNDLSLCKVQSLTRPVLFVLHPFKTFVSLSLRARQVVSSEHKTHKTAQTIVRGDGLEPETRGFPTTRGVDAQSSRPSYPLIVLDIAKITDSYKLAYKITA